MKPNPKGIKKKFECLKQLFNAWNEMGGTSENMIFRIVMKFWADWIKLRVLILIWLKD